MQPSLLLGTIFSIFSAGIYLYVGRTLSRRHVASADARLAWKMFVVWWVTLGGITLAGGLQNLLGALGLNSLPLFLTFAQLILLALCAALYGLMYYLVYLYTGNSKALVPLGLLYLGYYFFVMYYINLSVPVGVSISKWSVGLTYQQQPTGPLVILLLILLVFPQIIGALAYFTLYFRVKEFTQKYRVALVSGSIAIWFLSSFLGSLSGLNGYDWWQVLSRVIGLGATLAILMAYQPARWIKQRFGVSSILEENA